MYHDDDDHFPAKYPSEHAWVGLEALERLGPEQACVDEPMHGLLEATPLSPVFAACFRQFHMYLLLYVSLEVRHVHVELTCPIDVLDVVPCIQDRHEICQKSSLTHAISTLRVPHASHDTPKSSESPCGSYTHPEVLETKEILRA